MRIKINDKIYRLKEIESGVDSLVELVEEQKYKDGDFVVNEAGTILIFREEVRGSIYDHAFLVGDLMLLTNYAEPSFSGIKRYATEVEKQKLLNALAKDGKRWNEEKKCVEDIPKRKFKIGDKVRIKEGISSKTHRGEHPYFMGGMDELIEKELTVGVCANGIVCIKESGYNLHEDWLEPYVEELKEGDLAIFWDNNKKYAIIRFYKKLNGSEVSFRHKDRSGLDWVNAIKFESKEQFERLINEDDEI